MTRKKSFLFISEFEGGTVMREHSCSKLFLALLIILSILFSLCAQASFAEDSSESSDLFYLGQFQQEKDADFFGNEVIEWLILDVDEEENRALLVSYYALDVLPFDISKDVVSWNESSIREWLNHDFYETAFTEEEKQVILTTEIENGESQNNPDWPADVSEDTEDKVFLLSAAEYLKYFPFKDKCPYTAYAQDRGNLIFKETGSWWLRSPGKKAGEFCVADKGKVTSRAANKATGICPAIWVDYSKDMSDFPFERFVNAIELEDDYGEYLKAFEIFDSLGTYEYGFYFAAESLLKYSIESEDNDEERIQRLLNYQKYCKEHDLDIDEESLGVSSYDLLNDAYYSLAVKAQEAGEYERAIGLYTMIGQYGDATKHIIECYKMCGIQYVYMETTLVNAGKKGGNYSESKSITRSDIDNGCELGSFIISGFTEKEESGTKTTFVKTRGHDMTLWFDLERNIDDLPGNGKRSILSDPKGWDTTFKAPESVTDFGRGTLLVQHVGADGKPRTVIYTDYLAAKETGTANTRIEIKEEGIYNVALDYMIKNSDLKEALNSTTCYRISFSFEVKNGSGMVYLFDTETGSELEDYSRTEAGFRIDKGNSKSVKVNYIRFAINQNGNALDVRASAPASDGDVFTETGYYILTMINTETGVALEKHIFVGDQSDLEEYSEIELELKKFY